MTRHSLKSFTWFKTYFRRLQTYTQGHSIIKYMEWSPALEAGSRTARKLIRPLMWNPDFDRKMYKTPLLATVLGQMNHIRTILPDFYTLIINIRSRDNSVGTATGNGLDGRGENLSRANIFPSPQRPDRLRGPPSLLSNEYRRPFLRG
jgi:hypothetical protein